MKKLKLAFLWHQHQPYYKIEDEFILPWVRFHGVKDYYDLPVLLKEYPNLKQTINLVPSLLIQIEDYISGKCKDKVQILTEVKASDLNYTQKKDILHQFFVCNYDNMIAPYPRYKELYEKSQNNLNNANEFSSEEFLDLQVWYNLTWIGEISKLNTEISYLFEKGRHFTEEDKLSVLEHHLDILSKIIPLYKELQESGQIEISCSPFFHPILPLVCDTNIALESNSNKGAIEHRFAFPQDAEAQIKMSNDYYYKIFGVNPKSYWSSEGCVSNQVINMLADNGIENIATDEQILSRSVSNYQENNSKFFPYRYSTNNGNLNVFFRDTEISDKIGFLYSNWNEFDAVNDMMQAIESKRNRIIDLYGEDCLDNTVLTIILDGENCWEFYRNNGIFFLKNLFERLENSEIIETIRLIDSPQAIEQNVISNIHPGSWINANFDIWIGHHEDKTAWNILRNARQAIEDNKNSIYIEKVKQALNFAYIAEGSDWFWWFGDEHNAPNRFDFDTLFKYYIRKIYESINVEVPEELHKPIMQIDLKERKLPSSEIYPYFDYYIREEQWENAGLIVPKLSNSGAMHTSGEFIDILYYGKTSDCFTLRVDLKNRLKSNDKIEIIGILGKYLITIENQGVRINNEELHIQFRYLFSDVILLEIKNFDLFYNTEFKIITNCQNTKYTYPERGTYKFEF
jgi:alpha-amylase/alpha-mannosidase (GH57 family)